LMMNPVPWLQMTNMISYQGLVRTFPKELADSAMVRLIDRKELQNYLDDYNQKIIEDFQSES
ncbi:hypothetical protein U4T66_24145, partial [Escherichia coli]|nr:hypothetical protein [Escherichia coli]MDZ6443457.1 hypothetical protein [Escherichia coli]